MLVSGSVMEFLDSMIEEFWIQRFSLAFFLVGWVVIINPTIIGCISTASKTLWPQMIKTHKILAADSMATLVENLSKS